MVPLKQLTIEMLTFDEWRRRSVLSSASTPTTTRIARTMTRKFSLIIEGEDSSYSAYVPELPTILVTGCFMDELTVRATEAIRLYWATVNSARSPTSTLREIEVELPAEI